MTNRRSSVAMRGLVVVGLCVAAHGARADNDPVTIVDDPAAARALIPEGATCIPRALAKRKPSDPTLFDLQLGVADGKPTLCVVAEVDSDDAAAPTGPLACWTVDAAKRALTPRSTRMLPGRTVPARIEHGCARGLCLPRGVTIADDTEVQVALSDGEDLAVIIDGLIMGMESTAYLFDRATRKYRGKRDVGIGLRSLLVGHALVVEEAPAGPAAFVNLYDLDQPAREAFDPSVAQGSGDTRSIYLGFISVLERGVIAVAAGGLTDVLRVDLAAGTTKSLRHRKATRCIEDALDETEDLRRCRKPIARDVDPYTDADVISLGGQYLARLSSGELALLDAKLAVKKRFSPYCAK